MVKICENTRSMKMDINVLRVAGSNDHDQEATVLCYLDKSVRVESIFPRSKKFPTTNEVKNVHFA